MRLDDSSNDSAQTEAVEFRCLLETHGSMLARYVRHRIANATDAEDVLQEALVAAWAGFRRVRNPTLLSAYLLHVAQNRCRDYFRSRQRQEIPLAEETLHIHANRLGWHQYHRAERASDLRDALAEVPEALRRVAREFYLEGLSIAEIATETNRPAGTVKRHLFQARQALRIALDVPTATAHAQREKDAAMTSTTIAPQIEGDAPALFPPTRPEIRVTLLNEEAFAVDCQELRCWAIIPSIGETAATADYFPPAWQIDEVTAMRALRPSAVHDVEGVEIEVRSWKPASGWRAPGSLHARLTEESAEYLAVHLPGDDSTVIETFLDENFAWNWGTLFRAIFDTGVLHRNDDSSIRQSASLSAPSGKAIGIGLVEIQIGDRTFTCLRTLEAFAEGTLSKSEDYLTESFLTREGRTVLVRRYCHPRFVEAAQFPVVLDESKCLTIDGVRFTHWYDTLTNIAFEVHAD